ncbi:MAG TPA: C40 family peptidase [Bacteroidota bacterium]
MRTRRQTARSAESPMRGSGRWLIAVAWCGMLLAGCSSTSPRYRPAPEPEADEMAWDDAGAAPVVIQEMRAEDDRKVDLRDLEPLRREEVTDDTPQGVSRDRVLLNIISFLGVPYRYGGMSKTGIDCSGFTALIFSSAADRALPRSTREQYQVGVRVLRKSLRFADLVFFNTTGRTPSHVGIYLENNLFAHASLSEGVTLSSLESTYYKKRFIGARRVID